MSTNTLQIIGVDFDNTIIDYSDVIHKYAVKNNFIPPDTVKKKLLYEITYVYLLMVK